MDAHQRRVHKRKVKRDFITALRGTKKLVESGKMSFLEAAGKLRFHKPAK